MSGRLTFILNRLRERLWVKPLLFCLLSVAAALLARLTDYTQMTQWAPEIDPKSIESLLTIISASMLVISTFAVASMVSAFAAASSTATPRSFVLVVADDVSQNALSAFIGAFIFSIVALIATKNTYYGPAGNFTIFVITLLVFGLVILTFLRWVDRIARLGRLSSTIEKVEEATAKAMQTCQQPSTDDPYAGAGPSAGEPLFPQTIGYLQRIDLSTLQKLAEEHQLYIAVQALPGSFTLPNKALAYVEGNLSPELRDKLAQGFTIGRNRTFDEDPRFGLIALAEIASRALSPAVNDPGTAIVVLDVLVRLFCTWIRENEQITRETSWPHVLVPAISVNDMLNDAFTPIARDGAGILEVQLRLQKTFEAIAHNAHQSVKDAVKPHAVTALARAKQGLSLPADYALLKQSSSFAHLAA